MYIVVQQCWTSDRECMTVPNSDSECGAVLEGVYSCVTVLDK